MILGTVHCVWVSLTGTIVALFGACGSLVRIGFPIFECTVYNTADIVGPLYDGCVKGLRPSNETRYLNEPVVMM